MRLGGIEPVAWIVEFPYVIGVLECIITRGIMVLWPVGLYRRDRALYLHFTGDDEVLIYLYSNL
jgi:hypothetical protein